MKGNAICYTLLYLFLFSIQGVAQQIEWASGVKDYSSQLTQVQYSAKQALGKPSVLPGGGPNPTAWMPEEANGKDYLRLSFDHPMPIRQIAIAESFNPGAIARITAFEKTGQEHQIATFIPAPVPIKSRILNVFIEKTLYAVAELLIEFDATLIGDFAIDAVAITDAGYPVVAKLTQSVSTAAGIILEPMGKHINSSAKEINPLLSPDGKTLYFGRMNHEGNVGGVNDKEDIWYSEIDEKGNWKLARNMGAALNTAGPNYINSIYSTTPDGKSVVMMLGNQVSKDGKKVLNGVSFTTKKGNSWTKPAPINITNNYNYSEHADYFLANNRQTMILAVERMDTKGDRDLYVSFMGKDSVWSEPLHMGSVINTPAEESAPFLGSDDKTLYFSSRGFSGLGGSDIYLTRRLDDTWTNWSEPQNIGPTINSPFDDGYFTMPDSSSYCYYSRGVSATNTDIYRAKLPAALSPILYVTIQGTILDSKTKKPVGTRVEYERLPELTEKGFIQSDPLTGNFELRLPAGYQYNIHANAKDTLSEVQQIDTRYQKNFSNLVLNLTVQTIEKGVTLRLNSVFFEYKLAVVKPESFPELDRIADLLKEKTTMKIEISGHTDNIGGATYNQKLSTARAEAVMQYLVSRGAPADHIISNGYGDTKPVANNAVEKGGRELNRRVEFAILEL